MFRPIQCLPLLLLLGVLPARADPLPEQVRLDRYLVEIAEHERWEQWDKACALYELIEAEHLPKPVDFEFRFGATLFRARRDAAAKARLTSFVQHATREDPNYAMAMQHLVDVDRRLALAQEEAEREGEARNAADAARAKLEEERAMQRVKDVQRRRVFLDTELTASAALVGTGLVPAGIGGATLLGALLVGSFISEGESFLPSLVGGLVGVGVGFLGKLVLPDWTSFVSPAVIVGAAVVLAVVVPVVMYAARLGGSRDLRFGVTMASIAFGGGVLLAVSGLWELSARQRYDAAVAAKAAFEAEQRARPLPTTGAARPEGSSPGEGVRIGLVEASF